MKLIFISYINRSGSTFLANEFSKQNSILVYPEAEVLVYYFIQHKKKYYCEPNKLRLLLSEILIKDSKFKYWNLNITDFNDLTKYKNNFEIFFDILNIYKNKVKPEATVFIFKADNIAYYYKNIPLVYYDKLNIKFILIIRDGRASYASQRETIGTRKQKPMNMNPVKAAKIWVKWITFVFDHKGDQRFINLIYEELIRNLKNSINYLFSQMDIQERFQEKLNDGDLYKRIPINQRPMHGNIQKPPLEGNISKWTNLLPLSHITIFEKIAKKELTRTNYNLMNPDSNKVWTNLLYIYFWLTHLYLSSILNRWIRKAGKILVFRVKRIIDVN